MWARIGICLLLITQTAHAACVTIDRSAWTQEQKNFTEAIAYRLVFEAGENIVPTLSGDMLCFANSTVDLSVILTAQTILNRFAIDDAARDQATQAEQQRQAVFDTEVANNDWCTAELADLDTRINTVVSNLQSQLAAAPNTVAGVKTHLSTQLYPTIGAGFKKVARCLRARAR